MNKAGLCARFEALWIVPWIGQALIPSGRPKTAVNDVVKNTKRNDKPASKCRTVTARPWSAKSVALTATSRASHCAQCPNSGAKDTGSQPSLS